MTGLFARLVCVYQASFLSCFIFGKQLCSTLCPRMSSDGVILSGTVACIVRRVFFAYYDSKLVTRMTSPVGIDADFGR
jgi:hypothetical protein